MMTHRLRVPLVNPNDENLHAKMTIKSTLSKQPSFPTRRPALTEVGNKVAKPTQLKRHESIPLKKPASQLILTKAVTKSLTTEAHSTKQIAIIDPDVETAFDPQSVSEYVKDIYIYLRELEEKYPVKSSFLQGHSTTPKMRTILVNWLSQVHTSFKFCLETLHMSISLVDRYLQIDKKVDRRNLQLVGAVALLISAKYEETQCLDVMDFVSVTDDAFSIEQLFAMERHILNELNFNLGKPLPVHFLRRFSKVARVNSKYHDLSKFIVESTLLEHTFSHYNPSLLAAAACCISIGMLNDDLGLKKIWNNSLEHYSTYKYDDLRPLLIHLSQMILRNHSTKYTAVKDKYSSGRFSKISLNECLKGKVVTKLASLQTSVTKQ